MIFSSTLLAEKEEAEEEGNDDWREGKVNAEGEEQL